jgi:hypothetical protein
MSKFPIKEISAEEEAKLWQRPLFIFDTSALCRLYSLTEEVREDMLVILDVLKDEIWIPHRVMLEYNRHRIEELHKPLGMYGKPAFLEKNHLSSELKDYIERLEQESYRHPQFEQSVIDNLKQQSEELDKILTKIRVSIENALKAGKDKVAKAILHDAIEEAINDLNSGDALTIDELKSIIAEGHIRYTYKIPPGYEDAETKTSVDVFGDLIIWKEIIKHARKLQKNTSIIFITQDLKEDWNASDSKDSISPREELLIEFETETGRNIWIYTISDFLSKLGQYRAGAQSLTQPLKKVETIKLQLELANIPDDEIKVRCSHCNRVAGYTTNDFEWDWQWYGQDDREMGAEISYQSDECVECPHCGRSNSISFFVYQYPIGVVNYVDCEAEEGEIIYIPDDLENFIDLSGMDMDIRSCCRCGEYYPASELDDSDLCENCIREIDKFINSDD